MIDRKYEQLMQDVLDGQATPEQIRELEGWLAGSTEGRARFEELQSLFQTLAQMTDAATPEGLKDDVLRAIRSRTPVVAPAHSRPHAHRPVFRPAFVFAAGLAAGVIGYAAFTRLPAWPPGDTSAVGTMMPQPDSPPGAAAARRSWTAGEARVEALSWRRGGIPIVSIKVRGDARVELQYPAGELELRAIGQNHAQASQVRSEPGRVIISATDRSEFELEWAPGATPPPLQVTVRAGQSAARGDLPVGAVR